MKKYDLYELIRTLSSSEKKLFKEKYAGNENLDKMYRANLVTVNTIDRSGIYSHLKRGPIKFGDIIVTGGQQRLSNGSLVVVSDKAGIGTEQPAETPKL